MRHGLGAGDPMLDFHVIFLKTLDAVPSLLGKIPCTLTPGFHRHRQWALLGNIFQEEN